MTELFKAFAGIATFRLGPEDLPASNFLLLITLFLYTGLQLPVAMMIFPSPADVARSLALDLVMTALAPWLLLALLDLRNRYLQTLTAMFGAGALLTLLSLPCNLWRAALGEDSAAAALPNALLFGIVIWSLAVNGHIYARALSRPFLAGIMVAIAMFFLQTTLLFRFVPMTD